VIRPPLAHLKFIRDCHYACTLGLSYAERNLCGNGIGHSPVLPLRNRFVYAEKGVSSRSERT